MNIVNDWEKQILTAQDIARIFKCGKNLAYKIIESDDMNAVRIGSTIRVSMKSFNEWINNKGFLLNNEETFDNQVYTLEEIKDLNEKCIKNFFKEYIEEIQDLKKQLNK